MNGELYPIFLSVLHYGCMTNVHYLFFHVELTKQIELLVKGVSARVLMELAGHKNLATTQGYVDVNDMMLLEAAELL